MKAINDLQSGSCPRAILKICPPSSLDYRARHGPQTQVRSVFTSFLDARLNSGVKTLIFGLSNEVHNVSKLLVVANLQAIKILSTEKSLSQ